MKLQEDWVYPSSLLIKKNIFRKTFKCHILHNKWSFPLRTSSVNGPNPQKTVDLVPFTEEILNGKIHFLCSVWIPCISVDKPYFISNEDCWPFWRSNSCRNCWTIDNVMPLALCQYSLRKREMRDFEHVIAGWHRCTVKTELSTTWAKFYM